MTAEKTKLLLNQANKAGISNRLSSVMITAGYTQNAHFMLAADRQNMNL
jgi:hypothetical protein